MFVRDLPEDARLRIAKLRFDRMIEKHEGPWDWQWWLEDAEFFVAMFYHERYTIPFLADGKSG